jgi:type IV secretory pathway VirB4 component
MADTSNTTQTFVPIKEVKDGIAVLKDDSLRAILMVSSLNFALKSDDERQSILYQFQNMLNSLDFSVQIYIQSRRLDIRPYLALLEQRQKEVVEELLKIQIREYIGFVRSFTEANNIMTKGFFVVIPYTPAIIHSGKGGLPQIPGFGKKKTVVEQKKQTGDIFEENRTQIEQRISIVEEGLIRSGLRAARLGTDEVIELFYKIFNPGETDKPIQL